MMTLEVRIFFLNLSDDKEIMATKIGKKSQAQVILFIDSVAKGIRFSD